jgi:hypothetical protein
MGKYRYFIIGLVLCASAAIWAYLELTKNAASGTASAAARAAAGGGRVYEAGPDGRPASAMVMKAAMGAVPKPEKVYKLSGDIKQEDLLKTLLGAVSENTAAAGLKSEDWDMDWGEDSDTRSTKTFYRSGPQKDRVSLDAFLLGTSGAYGEVVLRASLRVCSNPSQGDLLEALRKEGFEVKSPTSPVHGFGSNYWRSIFEVRRGGLSGLTYYVAPTGVTGCLELQLRDKKIAEALPAADFTFSAMFPPDLSPRLTADLEGAGIAGILGGDWEKVKGVFASTAALSRQETEILGKAYAALAKAVVKAGQDPAFGVLRGHLVRRIFGSGDQYGPNGETNPLFVKMLVRDGIGHKESHYGGVYPEKQYALELYEAAPESYWGQYVFLRNMDGGFSGEDCYYGLLTEQPIKRGSEFIGKHPRSPFLADVLFLLGQAYETLYNQGFSAEAGDEYAGRQRAELAAGFEGNRAKATELYGKVLSAPGGEKYKPFIDKILPRLRVGGRSYCHHYFPRCD